MMKFIIQFPIHHSSFLAQPLSLALASPLHEKRTEEQSMIRKLKSGEYRLYSRKKDSSGKRRNLGTFSSRAAAERHEREVQFFKRH